MKAWQKALLGAAGLTGYVRWMDRRNGSRSRPPIRDSGGREIRTGRFTYRDGATVPIVDRGTGPSLLLVPGADGVVETFRYQIPRFSESFRVLCAGLRTQFDPDDSFDRFSADLREVIRGRGAGPVVLLGQSLGGAIAMRFASRHPDLVRALVLSNTLTRYTWEHVGLNRTALVPLAQATTRYLPAPLARAMAYGWARAEVWMFDDSPGRDKLVDYVMNWGPRTVSSAVGSERVNLLRQYGDLRPELPSIEAPTLVVKGERDAYCPPEWSREIADLIPNARYVPIPGTGHCSHVSMPGLFNDVVLEWLTGGSSWSRRAAPERGKTRRERGEGP